ncbi:MULTISPECIES: hypothetical protein [unclassified Moorena]|uniref:hypothetical protein n=1 Tax=unclassified Moorena TaxID=2683338 RepID=UPI001400126E|nr:MULTISPECIES: hypothetical protein [unclassified Moorena]NEO15373.1 hypothetical protein [Moorena sp. SIO3E8]NEQ01125.1 hypothetical protein [Moorena sp. SIO3F7]
MNNKHLDLGKILINTGLVVAGLTGLLATSANAESAIRGSVVETRPSGSSLSVSGELILPDALHFPGPLVVTPTYDLAAAGTNTATITNLTLDGGTAVAVSGTTGSSSTNAFLEAAATALGAATAVEDQAALIRAGAGTEGLGALD